MNSFIYAESLLQSVLLAIYIVLSPGKVQGQFQFTKGKINPVDLYRIDFTAVWGIIFSFQMPLEPTQRYHFNVFVFMFYPSKGLPQICTSCVIFLLKEDSIHAYVLGLG